MFKQCNNIISHVVSLSGFSDNMDEKYDNNMNQLRHHQNIYSGGSRDGCMTVVSSNNNNNKAFENTAFIWLSLSKPRSHELRSCHLSVSNYIELQFGLILTSCHDWHLIYALMFGDLSLWWQQQDKYFITLFHFSQQRTVLMVSAGSVNPLVSRMSFSVVVQLY